MKHQKLTLMFTDIVGYSRLMGANEQQTITLLESYRDILIHEIKSHDGEIIEFIGDAIFAKFVSSVNAVNAGLKIQRALERFNQNKDGNTPDLKSRIGIHQGEVAIKDGALFGDDVNIAARLEPMAVNDGLCISHSVYDNVRDDLIVPVLPLGSLKLKNIESRVKAYALRPNGINFATKAHYAFRSIQQKINAYRYPLATTLLLLVVAGVYWIPRILVPGYDANYLEIADFNNLMTKTGEPDYFSSGITEAIRSQVADMDNLYIVDPEKGVRGPVRLEGSVQKIDDKVRIAYKLFRRKTNAQIAGGKHDGPMSDIFILQDRVVAEIASILATEFKLKFFRPASLNLTSSVTAYDYYLQGIEFLDKPRSHENLDSAIKLLSTAIVHDSSFARANASLCNAYSQKYSLTQNTEWTKKAIIYCDKALSINSNLSEVYVSLGRIYMSVGRYDDALTVIKKVLDKHNGYVDAAIEMANIYRKKNDIVLAEKTFLAAIDMKPNFWKPYHELAIFYLKIGKLEKAIQYYNHSIKLTPQNAHALNGLGIAYFNQAQYKKAANFFSKSVELSPNSWSISNAGSVYYFAGDFKGAEKMYKQAIKMSPENFRFYYNLGDALRQKKETNENPNDYYKRSIFLAKKALKSDSNDEEIHQYLAMSYLFLGEVKKSKTYLDKATSLNPNNPYIVHANTVYWCILKDYERAFSNFKKLIQMGYSYDLVRADPDLTYLTNHKKFSNYNKPTK